MTRQRQIRTPRRLQIDFRIIFRIIVVLIVAAIKVIAYVSSGFGLADTIDVPAGAILERRQRVGTMATNPCRVQRLQVLSQLRKVIADESNPRPRRRRQDVSRRRWR
jgi:hypothetical protein